MPEVRAVVYWPLLPLLAKRNRQVLRRYSKLSWASFRLHLVALVIGSRPLVGPDIASVLG